jgi:hypothetical protein
VLRAHRRLPARGGGIPALASYYPSGPKTFVKKGQLNGWEQCFSGFYGDNSTTVDTVLTQCDGDPLLLAGGPTGSAKLTVLAAAPRDDVIFDTGTSNDPHNAHGSGWYFNDDYSWGFAKQGDPINRNTCDTNFDPNADLRLCWHTFNGFLDGGYRAGAIIELNDSKDYTRYVYQAGPDWRPPCPKRTLCVWKDENYQGKRLTIEGKGVSNEIAHKMNDEVTSFYNRRGGVSYLYDGKNATDGSYCIPQKGYAANIGGVFNDLASSSKLTRHMIPDPGPPPC